MFTLQYIHLPFLWILVPSYSNSKRVIFISSSVKMFYNSRQDNTRVAGGKDLKLLCFCINLQRGAHSFVQM